KDREQASRNAFSKSSAARALCASRRVRRDAAAHVRPPFDSDAQGGIVDISTGSAGSLFARRTRCTLAAATAAAVIGAVLTASPAAAVLAPSADGSWRFDFGTAGSPVADGYQQVLASSLYTTESGWGVTVADGVTLFDRNRTGNRTPADPVAEDFV